MRACNITRRFWKVWYRNLVVNRQNWKVSFLPPLLEPLFYLLAFGVGLSSLVGRIDYGGSQVTYVQFIAPALLAINIMNNAFFENTYSSYVRMYYQKTFDAMMATPLTLEEIITGEIFWGATKSFLATLIMLSVISLFGLVSYPSALLILPLSFLGGIAFGSLGMVFTGKVKTIDLFNLPIFLFITPMYLFSGTFFPLEALPSWARLLAYTLPLTHLVDMTRSLGAGRLDASLLWGLLYLSLFCAVFFPLAVTAMHKRLIA
ncbi:ABC transporter permease [Syntrophus buswellii]|jgi:lipooligosaccharide transport system permease protein|uniref:ABC transporter permease n=1 Tax=Syntrophus TaxID=43773 RepID=UPI00345E9A05